MSDMGETRYPVRVSYRSKREPMERIKHIAEAEDNNIGAVLRRVMDNGLTLEGRKGSPSAKLKRRKDAE